MISFEIDKGDIKEINRLLSGIKNGVPKALSRTLNKTVSNTKTIMIAIVRRKYNYKQSALSKRISIKKASSKSLTAAFISTGDPVHITDITGTRQTKKGVTFNVKKETGRKIIPRAFLNKGKHSGKKIVLRRPGDPRGQHTKLYGRYGPPGSGGKVGSRARLDTFVTAHPEILYNTKENWDEIQVKVKEKLDQNLKHETDVVLKNIA